MTDRKLMQQALHTLEGWANVDDWVWPETAKEQAKRNTVDAIDALRERLAQPEQEPVAWIDRHELSAIDEDFSPSVGNRKLSEYDVPLYTVPPQRKPWVGLTDEDMEALLLNEDGVRFARYIEAKLKERNG